MRLLTEGLEQRSWIRIGTSLWLMETGHIGFFKMSVNFKR